MAHNQHQNSNNTDIAAIEVETGDRGLFGQRCSTNLASATTKILLESFELAQEKQNLSRKDFKKLVKCLGWEHSEEKTYLKLSSAFKGFSPEKLAVELLVKNL